MTNDDYFEFFSFSNDCMAILDIDFEILEVNPAWAQHGMPSVNAGPNQFLGIIAEEDRERAKKMAETFIVGAKRSCVIDACVVRLTGEKSQFRWKLHTSADLKRVLCVGVEASAQDELPTRDVGNRQLIKNLIDHLPTAIFCKDSWHDFKLVLWNKTCEKWWGITEEQALGKNDYDFFPKEQADAFRAADVRALEDHTLIDIEEEDAFHIEKKAIKCHTLKVPVDDSGHPRYMLGISEDITERLRIRRELEDQKTLAVNSSKMATLGQMAGGIAHEINNPLGVIVLRASQARRLLASANPDISKVILFLNQIETTGHTIATIVNGLKTFARSGENDPLESVLVTTIISNTLALCAAGLENHKIRLELIGHEGLALSCRSVQLSQVLLNLLQNSRDALKDVDEGNGRFIRISCGAAAGFVVIKVQDNGAGISAGLRAKVMEPFFTTKAIGEGTGLGLSISKGIIESHGGEFYLDADEKLTTFVMKIPQAPSNM